MKRLAIFAAALSAAICAGAVTFTDGQDVTYLIQNPQLGEQDGWEVLVNNGETDNDKVRFDAANNLMEKWWGNLKVQQTIEGIPNGVYRLDIQGFQWHCWDWQQGAQWWADGNDQNTGSIALNNDAVKVQNLYSVGATSITEGYYADPLGYYVPNDAASARTFFNQGLYENTVETTVTDGKLCITLSMIEMSFWCCYTNARLTYVRAAGAGDMPFVPSGVCDRTAAETAKAMGAGINLGNTLEAGGGDATLYTNNGGLGAETFWQGTKTTQAVIDFIAAQGFKSVRIPCAWMMGHIVDNKTYRIDPEWMARVRQVVDYCIKDGLYVVLNDHWDGGWLESNAAMNVSGSAKDKNKTMLRAIWAQIAVEFRDYDYHLIFAGLNEPDAKTAKEVANLMEYEQVFVDAVRVTGGNNTNRVLVVQAPSTSHELACTTAFKMPEDTATDRLMVEVHYYNPWQFWGMEQDESWGKCFYYWGKENHVAGSQHNPNWDCEEDNMRYWLERLHQKYVVAGVPVLFGEFGANWRNLSGMQGESQEMHNASIYLYYHLLCRYSFELGMVPMAWDTNYPNYGMTIIDRHRLQVYNTIMMDAITEAVASGVSDVTADAPQTPAITCDLLGRRISPVDMQPGNIYIHNGRKFLKR